jgi:tRNA threonylcarbamoyladenosine biosynthesis protein TsaB
MELAIDTSTNIAGVALSENGKVLIDFTWHTEQNHTVELVPKVIYILGLQKADIHDMKAIVVAKGPGSFNGLRVGIATAKGLAFALSIPLVAISTLEIIAFHHAELGLPVCPIMNAGRGEIATALFQARNGKWDRVVSEHITTIDQLCSEIKDQTVLCGEINTEMSMHLRKELGDKASFPEESSMLRRISCLSELGWRRIESGDFDDIHTVQPLYLKRPAITIPKKRRHDAMSNMRSRVQ